MTAVTDELGADILQLASDAPRPTGHREDDRAAVTRQALARLVPGGLPHGATLAELYALRQGINVAVDREPVLSGQYL